MTEQVLIEEFLAEVTKTHSNSSPFITLLGDASNVNYKRLIALLDTDVTSAKVGSHTHAKMVTFLYTVISDPELTDKLITAISSYNDKEALGVLDG
mgnify:FL=1